MRSGSSLSASHIRWTFQEGVLANRLVWAFQNSYFCIDDRASVARKKELMNGRLELCKTGEVSFETRIPSSAVSCLLLGYVHGIVRARSIAQHINELSWRDTSHQHDETIAVSLSLGLTYDQIVGEERELFSRETISASSTIATRMPGAALDAIEMLTCQRRMRRFLVAVEHVPESITFMAGPKLPFPKFRWAPDTFMQTGYGSKLRIDPGTQALTRCTADGLLGRYRCFSFTHTRRLSVSDLNGRKIMLLVTIAARNRYQTCIVPSFECYATSQYHPVWTHLVVSQNYAQLELGDTAYGAIVNAREQQDGTTTVPEGKWYLDVHYLGPIILEGYNRRVTTPIPGFMDVAVRDEGLHDLRLR
jgi:hypothetical protein